MQKPAQPNAPPPPQREGHACICRAAIHACDPHQQTCLCTAAIHAANIQEGSLPVYAFDGTSSRGKYIMGAKLTTYGQNQTKDPSMSHASMPPSRLQTTIRCSYMEADVEAGKGTGSAEVQGAYLAEGLQRLGPENLESGVFVSDACPVNLGRYNGVGVHILGKVEMHSGGGGAERDAGTVIAGGAGMCLPPRPSRPTGQAAAGGQGRGRAGRRGPGNSTMDERGDALADAAAQHGAAAGDGSGSGAADPRVGDGGSGSAGEQRPASDLPAGASSSGSDTEELPSEVKGWVHFKCFSHIMQNFLFKMMLAMSGQSTWINRQSHNCQLGSELEFLSTFLNTNKELKQLGSFTFALVNDARWLTYGDGCVSVAEQHAQLIELLAALLQLCSAHSNQLSGTSEKACKAAELLLNPAFLVRCGIIACMTRHMLEHAFRWVQDDGGFHMLQLHAHVLSMHGLMLEAMLHPQRVFKEAFDLAADLPSSTGLTHAELGGWDTAERVQQEIDKALRVGVDYYGQETHWVWCEPWIFAQLADATHGPKLAKELLAVPPRALTCDQRMFGLLTSREMRAALLQYATTASMPPALEQWLNRTFCPVHISNAVIENLLHAAKQQLHGRDSLSAATL